MICYAAVEGFWAFKSVRFLAVISGGGAASSCITGHACQRDVLT